MAEPANCVRALATYVNKLTFIVQFDQPLAD
jgi:hypothetical protein